MNLADEPRASAVRFDTRRGRRYLTVILRDGQSHSVPLTFYPTLDRATAAARNNVRAVGGGIGFHWPALDFDLPVRGILEGRREQRPRTQLRTAG